MIVRHESAAARAPSRGTVVYEGARGRDEADELDKPLGDARPGERLPVSGDDPHAQRGR